MFETLGKARQKLERDRDEPWTALAGKAMRYLRELITAPLYLRTLTERGKGVRTLGRPRIENRGTMRIGSGTVLRSVNVPVELCTGPGAVLDIGKDVRINYGVSVGARGRIEIGDRVRVGPYAMIIDTEFHDLYDREKMPAPRPIVIEDDVWIGAKASVMPGVRIGTGSVVGVSSVVYADVPPFTVVAGVPARAVKKLDPTLLVRPPAEDKAGPDPVAASPVPRT
jgi:acetyltransferase-like isoleucine patch superfamily enzyme